MKKLVSQIKKSLTAQAKPIPPAQRVEAFIRDWHKQWSTAQEKMAGKMDFNLWNNLVVEVEAEHFIQGKNSATSGSFSSTAEFDAQLEKITACDIQGNSAQVYSELYDEALKSFNYHVYDLEKSDDDNWFISQVIILLYPPNSPVITADLHTDVLALSNQAAPFSDGEEYLKLNENILFQKDRDNTNPDKEIISLEQIGKFQVKSGVLGILDFGYNIYDFEPLQKRVPPGEYPVETVTINKRVAGIRIRFDQTKEPIKWYAANTSTGNGVYGVDAGNLAIFDVENLLKLTFIDKERLFNDWSVSGTPEVLSMTGTNDCIITSSGYGDGAYPAFWGVDEKDQILSLYIDFMILVEENDQGLYVSI